MRLFGRENERAIEREIKRNEGWIAWRSLNRPSVNLDRWRCRDICWGRYREKWSSTDTGIEEVSRNKSSDTRIEAQSIHQVSRSYRGCRNILDQYTRCREAIEIAIRKSWRSSTNSKVSRRYRASFLKEFFEMWKTQTWMQSIMQLNQWSNQHIKLSKSYLNKNFKHMDLQKHTHTHTH